MDQTKKWHNSFHPPARDIGKGTVAPSLIILPWWQAVL